MKNEKSWSYQHLVYNIENIHSFISSIILMNNIKNRYNLKYTWLINNLLVKTNFLLYNLQGVFKFKLQTNAEVGWHAQTNTNLLQVWM